MRIGFFNDKYVLGGAERVTGDIISGVKNIDPSFEFFIITLHYEDFNLSGGAKIITLPPDTKMKHTEGAMRLVGKVKELKLDTLIILIDPAPGLMPILRKNLPEVKLIVQYHSNPLWQVLHKTFNSRLKFLREKLFHTYSRRYLKRLRQECHYADAVITLCKAYSTQIKQLLNNDADAAKVHYIYNPLDLEINLNHTKNKEVIYVGRLSIPDKRVDRLMRIWQPIEHKHPDWKFKIIGIGEAESMMREQVREMGLKNVEFCGYSSNPTEYYKTASILCLTSDYEGWGLVIAEGLAYGIIPIAMNCSSGIRELLSDYRGILIPTGDEHAFISTLDLLISSIDNKTYINTSKTEIKSFLQNFTTEKIGANWIKLFNTLKPYSK